MNRKQTRTEDFEFISKEAFELRCPECGSEVSMVGDYGNDEFAGYECLMDDSHDTDALIVKARP